jgi:hypothetical protein
MLTAGVLKFDAQGRIILSAEAPIAFNGGMRTPLMLFHHLIMRVVLL